jgi:DNA adenine methylase
MKNIKNPLVAPVLKWVGGKRQLLDRLTSLIPEKITTYCEPFLGGGALLFHLQPKTAYVNDINEDLIRVYQVIKNDVETLIKALEGFKNEAEYFYSVRDWDRNKIEYSSKSDVERAARVIYLNKTCYNGLFRVNNAGEFNSPFGNYRNPNIVNAPTLRAVNLYFNNSKVKLTASDYADVLKILPKDTFVYLDPPYHPVSDTANFTGYSRGGFTRVDQVALRDACNELDKRGIKFMLSNSATDFIREHYANYKITTVQAKRMINSDSTKRGEIDEVVVRNYE